jgi:hypothetical protein
MDRRGNAKYTVMPIAMSALSTPLMPMADAEKKMSGPIQKRTTTRTTVLTAYRENARTISSTTIALLRSGGGWVGKLFVHLDLLSQVPSRGRLPRRPDFLVSLQYSVFRDISQLLMAGGA